VDFLVIKLHIIRYNFLNDLVSLSEGQNSSANILVFLDLYLKANALGRKQAKAFRLSNSLLIFLALFLRKSIFTKRLHANSIGLTCTQ
jgi:hypothetical protein